MYKMDSINVKKYILRELLVKKNHDLHIYFGSVQNKKKNLHDFSFKEYILQK